MPMLALLLAAAPAPQPGPIKAFGDWVVACDNGRACEMTSLYPGDSMPEEGSGWDTTMLSVARDPGPAGGFSVELQVANASGRVSIQVDATEVASGVTRDGLLSFAGADAARIVAAMANGKEMHAGDGGGTMLGRVSLAGSSAALRFIDAEQGRAGTASAAVAKGARPAGGVPGAAALPTVAFVRPSGRPEPVTAAMRAAWEKATDCGSAYAGGEGDPPAVETHALGGGATLALLPCGSGAYNFSTVPFVVRSGKGVIASFDFAPGWTEAEGGTPTLVNAGWDDKTARLSSYTKGRGIGDCGSSEEYVWDGTRFLLVAARQMPECRGSVNWLTVWRANPVAR